MYCETMHVLLSDHNLAAASILRLFRNLALKPKALPCRYSEGRMQVIAVGPASYSSLALHLWIEQENLEHIVTCASVRRLD